MSRASPPDNFDIVVHLLHLMGMEEAGRWLMTPRADLGGLTPDEALLRGRQDDVARLVFGDCIEQRLAS